MRVDYGIRLSASTMRRSESAGLFLRRLRSSDLGCMGFTSPWGLMQMSWLPSSTGQELIYQVLYSHDGWHGFDCLTSKFDMFQALSTQLLMAFRDDRARLRMTLMKYMRKISMISLLQ